MQYRGVLVCVALWACRGGKQPGQLGADCYPNGTCNATLACVGGLCVAAMNDAAIDTGVDAPNDARVDAEIDARLEDAPPDATCEPIQTMNAPDGHHNPGQSCLAVGCHLIGNAGAGAPEYSYAGTLYRDATGAVAFTGATMTIAHGTSTTKLITATNGNFYIPAALVDPPSAAMPAHVTASGCPDNATMVGAVVDNGGNCNNCHANGGTTGPVHLP